MLKLILIRKFRILNPQIHHQGLLEERPFQKDRHQTASWTIWRYFYLSHLPTREKKVRITIEGFLDLFFRRSDILAVGNVKRKKMEHLDDPIQSTFDLGEEHL